MADKNNQLDMGAAPEGRQWRVLVVDDCDKTVKLIEAELKGKGFEILLAASVDEATRLIVKKDTRPDLILLDVIMPVVDGRQFCRFIKSNEMFSGIKVILCSGIDADELEATAEKYGADGFVHKTDILGRWVLQQLVREQQGRE
jgi:CheY-like chemotaxis protein